MSGALLGNSTLTTLDLRHNGISLKGAVALADAVYANTALTALHVDHPLFAAKDGKPYKALKRNARAPAQREAAALAWLLLHGAACGVAPPNVVVSTLAALRPRTGSSML